MVQMILRRKNGNQRTTYIQIPTKSSILDIINQTLKVIEKYSVIDVRKKM